MIQQQSRPRDRIFPTIATFVGLLFSSSILFMGTADAWSILLPSATSSSSSHRSPPVVLSSPEQEIHQHQRPPAHCSTTFTSSPHLVVESRSSSSSVSNATPRRRALWTLWGVAGLFVAPQQSPAAAAAAATNHAGGTRGPTIDVNNALAREYTAFPGLYPTVATKIVNGAKDEPFRSKKDVYAILNEVEQERLRQYDKYIVIQKTDKALQQFKTSQICKYECGGRTSNTYRDEQIRSVQADRRSP